MRAPTPQSGSSATPSRCGTTAIITIAPPHRLPQPASHHPRPSTRHQTHDLIQCSRATRSMPRSGRAPRSGQSHHIHTSSKRSA